MSRCRTHTHRLLRPFATAVLATLCLFSAFLLAACGKTGYPLPPDSSRNFTWEKVEAKAVGNCLAFTGSFEGQYQNFDGIRLELSRINGPDDCPGCPFVPQEVTEISPRDAGFNRQKGTIAFSYCPQKAPAYRWRLAAISIFNRLPHATMTDRLLVTGQ